MKPRPDWPLEIALDREDERPLFRQLTETLAQAVATGRLRPGMRLPGTRRLAEHLGVHRNTVMRAFADLVADGWLASSPSSGTYVPDALPSRPRPGPLRAEVPYPLPPRMPYDARRPPESDAGTLTFTSLPDVTHIPQAAWSRAWRRVLKLHARRALDYGSPVGDDALRAALAEMLSTTRGMAVGSDDLLVTRGSQMALYLIGAALLGPGDVVLVERVGYAPAWRALAVGGATVMSVPVDGDGVDVDAIDALCRTHPVRAVYVTPHHQYPTTVSLVPARRMALTALAARHRFAIIEDDYDHEFRYDGPPLFPMASTDDAGAVIYVGTLSKVLAPGLRTGFVVAPRPVLDRLIDHRLHLDRQGDAVGERALAELFADGEVQRHVRRMRRLYRKRRDICAANLRRHLPDALDFELPVGGMAIWARVRAPIDLPRWREAALKRGVWLMPPRALTFDGTPPDGLRLGFARLDGDQTEDAIRRLAAALDDL